MIDIILIISSCNEYVHWNRLDDWLAPYIEIRLHILIKCKPMILGLPKYYVVNWLLLDKYFIYRCKVREINSCMADLKKKFEILAFSTIMLRLYCKHLGYTQAYIARAWRCHWVNDYSIFIQTVFFVYLCLYPFLKYIYCYIVNQTLKIIICWLLYFIFCQVV